MEQKTIPKITRVPRIKTVSTSTRLPKITRPVGIRIKTLPKVKKINPPVVKDPVESGKHGRIRVRNVGRGVAYPKVPGYENIPAWSRGKKPWKELSPFIIGPVVYEELQGDGSGSTKLVKAELFENFWQAQKVWPSVDRQKQKNWTWPAEVHVMVADSDTAKDPTRETTVTVDETNTYPNAAWYRWHESLLAHDKPVRRPNGRAVPLYAWWKGQKLKTVEGRKQIYIPYLQQLYRAHPIYQQLLQKVKEGKNIIILEPDGPPHESFPDGLEMDLPLLYSLQNVTQHKDFPGSTLNPSKYVPYGHGYVIALSLLEDLQE